jgi:2-polyprenyl-6-methoxyphenol hydroxylase-like FAD-dependent oxidoreductase
VNTDVIVVGAGPTGLMLAGELALAGVRVIVLDRLAERSPQSKALNLLPRTVEVFDLRGLVERAEPHALRRWGSGHFGGRPISFDGWQSRRAYQLFIPQTRVEQVLTERLAELGVTVTRDRTLVSLSQDADGVTAVLADGAELTARFLVGCDGGRSAVRKQLGVGFPGTDATVAAFVADLVFAVPPPRAPHRLRSARDVVAGQAETRARGGLIPMEEPGLFRFMYTDPDGDPKESGPVARADVDAAVRRLYGDEAEIGEVRWSSRFGNTTRQAERYRTGRVLLAGDAAHVHFPAGGQGLNLGVQDAVNLGWKLAAEVRGWAPPGLLDSYHDERHPVGARVLENTLAQTVPPDPSAETLAVHRLLTDLVDLPEVNRHLAGMVSGLDIRYPVDGPEHPLLGARLPDLELPDGWSSTLFHAGRGVLLTTDPADAELAAPWAGRVTATVVPALPGLDTGAVLARPDGHVCWLPGGKPLDSALPTHFGTP